MINAILKHGTEATFFIWLEVQSPKTESSGSAYLKQISSESESLGEGGEEWPRRLH